MIANVELTKLICLEISVWRQSEIHSDTGVCISVD